MTETSSDKTNREILRPRKLRAPKIRRDLHARENASIDEIPARRSARKTHITVVTSSSQSQITIAANGSSKDTEDEFAKSPESTGAT